MKSLWEQLMGVNPPFRQAAFFEAVASLIFLAALFWPHLSLVNLVRGLLIGCVWAVSGFVSYLRALGASPW